MQRKIFRTGNSTVVSLPKEALDFLRLNEGADVSVELDRENRRILITPAGLPVAAAGVDEEFARQLVEFIAQYRPALEALARQ
jgi:antitoxin component of MazEF toxin-antitoxin module